jgi:hypothetical protein
MISKKDIPMDSPEEVLQKAISKVEKKRRSRIKGVHQKLTEDEKVMLRQQKKIDEKINRSYMFEPRHIKMLGKIRLDYYPNKSIGEILGMAIECFYTKIHEKEIEAHYNINHNLKGY